MQELAIIVGVYLVFSLFMLVMWVIARSEIIYWRDKYISLFCSNEKAWEQAFSELKRQWDSVGVVYDIHGYIDGVPKVYIKEKK